MQTCFRKKGGNGVELRKGDENKFHIFLDNQLQTDYFCIPFLTKAKGEEKEREKLKKIKKYLTNLLTWKTKTTTFALPFDNRVR